MSTQPWWRPYSVAWIVTANGAAEAVGQVVAGGGDQPVVAVDDVEVVAVAHLHARGEHVRVHVLDPGDELAQVARALRLAHAVDDHAAGLLLGRVLLAPAGEHVHVHALSGEVLGQLAHVPREAALDQRRVLPGEDQGPHQGEVSAARSRSGARLRTDGLRHGGGVCQSAERGVQVGAVGVEPLARVVARQLAGGHEGPVAGLHREQLARRPLQGRARACVPGGGGHGAQLGAPRGDRHVAHAAASPRSTGPCRCPRSRARGPPAAGSTRSSPSLTVTRSSPWRGASSSTAASQCRPLVPPVAEQLGVERAAEQAAVRPARRAARSTKSRACSRASARAASRSYGSPSLSQGLRSWTVRRW